METELNRLELDTKTLIKAVSLVYVCYNVDVLVKFLDDKLIWRGPWLSGIGLSQVYAPKIMMLMV